MRLRIAGVAVVAFMLAACTPGGPDTVLSLVTWSQPAQATDWGLVSATVKAENMGDGLSDFRAEFQIAITCADTSVYAQSLVVTGLLDPGEALSWTFTVDSYGKQVVATTLAGVRVTDKYF